MAGLFFLGSEGDANYRVEAKTSAKHLDTGATRC